MPIAQVWLLRSCRDFYDHDGRLFHANNRAQDYSKGGTLLTEEMLEWPMYRFYGGEKITDKEMLAIYKSVLSALAGLKGFFSAVSIWANVENKYLAPTHRDWGQIYDLKSWELVANFSHDTRYENCPFSSVLEWPERHEIGGDENQWDRIVPTLTTTEAWNKIFFNRIRFNAEEILRESWGNSKRAAFAEHILGTISAPST